MKKKINEIINKARPVLKEAGVLRSDLFGSYVRGENKKGSDIDILVDLPREKSLFDFVELQFKLEKALKRKVDLGEYSAIKPRLRKNILESRIQIL